jgi:hypothetical protein
VPVNPSTRRKLGPLRKRVAESFPLVLAALGFLAGAWFASTHQLRIFSSPYPLWIVLALNAVVAALAGIAGLFVMEPEGLPEVDSSVVTIPRSEWEALTLPARAPPSPLDGPRPWVTALPDWATLDPVVPKVMTAPVRLAPPPRTTPPTPVVDATALRREMALLELEGIAEGGVATGENLGTQELQTFLDVASEDLTRISKLLGAPRRLDETPSAVLVRLLRLAPTMKGLPPGRLTATNMERLATKLTALVPTPNERRSFHGPGADLEAAANEFEELLRELEPSGAKAVPTKPPVKRAKPDGPD